ncbi:O-methyltransferase [Limisalsivibrio acetivorans]|uniref:O-methyltransferase n=1 Tax=Limisalsivibrio acetivorans TaxID=1304888 RepID=UPI0003B5808D|nr:methyltransferase domain-containing protein [Limisalsivibrio acetivorans]
MYPAITDPNIDRFLASFHRGKLKDIHDYAEKHGVPSVEPEVGELLCILSKLSGAERILDLGCGIGASTNYLYRGSPGARITGIDFNCNRVTVAKALSTELGSDIEFFCMSAPEYLEQNGETFDLVFVDTVKRKYSHIWNLIKKRINPGGIVIFDDVLLFGYPAMERSEIPEKYRQGCDELIQFLEEVKTEKPEDSTILPIASGVMLIQF